MWTLVLLRQTLRVCVGGGPGAVALMLMALFPRSAVETDQKVRMARCCKEVSAHLVDLFLGEEIFQTAKETLQELQCYCKYLQR